MSTEETNETESGSKNIKDFLNFTGFIKCFIDIFENAS